MSTQKSEQVWPLAMTLIILVIWGILIITVFKNPEAENVVKAAVLAGPLAGFLFTGGMKFGLLTTILFLVLSSLVFGTSDSLALFTPIYFTLLVPSSIIFCIVARYYRNEYLTKMVVRKKIR